MHSAAFNGQQQAKDAAADSLLHLAVHLPVETSEVREMVWCGKGRGDPALHALKEQKEDL